MCYVPVTWELVVGMAVLSFAVMDDLNRKSPTRDQQNTAVVSHLSFTPAASTCFFPCWSMVHVLEGTIFILVWSQLRINSAGMSSICTVSTRLVKNSCFKCQSLQTSAYSLPLLPFSSLTSYDVRGHRPTTDSLPHALQTRKDWIDYRTVEYL